MQKLYLFGVLTYLLALPIVGYATTQADEDVKAFEKIFGKGVQEEDYYRTDRLLLTATKHMMEARKAPAIATVVTNDEIRNMGARNLLDILKRVPGLAVGISELPTKSAIEVRGVRTKNTEKILFMINGHRMNNSLTGSAINIMDNLSVDSIERVEVVRGPGSALYGANAFIAVINVVTKTAADFEGVTLTAGGGSFSTQHYNLQAAHEGDEIEVAAFFDYFDTDGPQSTIEADAQTLNDARHGTMASVAPGNTLEWEEKKDFGLNVSYGNLSFLGRVIDKDKGPYIGVGRALNDETVQEFKQITGDIVYTKKILDIFDLEGRIYGDRFDWDTYWEIFPEGYAGVFTTGFIGNPQTTNETYGVEVSADYIWSNHLFTAGINAEEVEQKNTESYDNFSNPGGPPINTTATNNFNQDVDRNFWALYIQDVWQIEESLSLTVGVRHDSYSDFGGSTNPRLGLVWQPLDDLTLKLLFGNAFRAPTFTEQYTINNPAEIGNVDLDPETIRTYEAGAEYNFFKHYSVQLNYFRNEIDDLIILGPKPSPTEPAPYVNRPGQTTIDGAELILNADFGKNKYGYLNLSYQHSEDFLGEPLPDVAEWKGNLGVNWELTQYVNANCNLNYIGERRRATGDFREDLNSSAIVDIAIIVKNFYNSLELRASVYNLFDEDYRDPSPNILVPNDYPTSSRSLFFELRYSF